MWEPLSYPLLFPEGTPGWGIADTANTRPRIGADQYQHRVDAPTMQMWFYRAQLLREPRFQIFGRLANEYMVDMFSRDLECRLAYIRANQRRICQEEATLHGLNDAEYQVASEGCHGSSSSARRQQGHITKGREKAQCIAH